ncbi:MAG: SpoIIE family protein phosphatase [Deltaproteobacteria bacterium]|nr:SpoIIE family protein phosphatase [Deltaproteobacteria bacterium]
MLQDPGYLVNRHRRSVRFPGLLGARLRAGSTGSLQAAGVGDGILIHPDKAFFAVGDGSDRNPRAVRQAMECFVALLEGFPGLKAGRIYREEEAAELRDSVLLAAAGLIRDLYPSDGCTFTGILLFRTAGGFRGLLFHAGDSLLYRIDTESGETQRLTENNFWFVGRTSRFSQVEEIPLRPSSLLLLATDGFAALLPSGEGDGTSLGEVCRRHPVEELPDLLFDRYDRPGEVLDDAAVLCLVPAGQTGGSCQPIILGGTNAEEEKQRSKDIREHPPGDCYQSGTPDTAAGCGAIL